MPPQAPPTPNSPPRYQRWSTMAANNANPEEQRARPREEVFDEPTRRPARGPWMMFGLILGIGVAGFWFSMQTDYLLGLVGVPVLAIATLHGLCRGGFHKMLMLPVTMGIAYIAVTRPEMPSAWFTTVTGKTSELGGMIVGIVCAMLAVLLASFLAQTVRRRVIVRQRFLLGMDRVFGTVVGLAEGAFFVLCLCWTAALLQPQALTVRDHANTKKDSFKHHFANTIVRLTEEVDNFPQLQPLVRDANLLKELPAVQEAIEKFKQSEGLKVNSIDEDLFKQAGDVLNRTTPGRTVPMRRPYVPPSK